MYDVLLFSAFISVHLSNICVVKTIFFIKKLTIMTYCELDNFVKD